MSLIRPTRVTAFAAVVGLCAISLSTAFVLARYASLPDLLPVHFRRDGLANGWQYKTYARVLLPVFVQAALSLTLGMVGALLLWRERGAEEHDAPDVRAAAAAAEGVVLITAIWIVFQAYVAFALTALWQRGRAGAGASGLGPVYVGLEVLGVVLTIGVAVRTNIRLGRPAARPYVAQHWRYGQLYRNPEDPALFVPTRHGSRWTLNFGRPVAAALMGGVLLIGVVGPTIILTLLLR